MQACPLWTALDLRDSVVCPVPPQLQSPVATATSCCLCHHILNNSTLASQKTQDKDIPLFTLKPGAALQVAVCLDLRFLLASKSSEALESDPGCSGSTDCAYHISCVGVTFLGAIALKGSRLRQVTYVHPEQCAQDFYKTKSFKQLLMDFRQVCQKTSSLSPTRHLKQVHTGTAQALRTHSNRFLLFPCWTVTAPLHLYSLEQKYQW